MILRDMIVLGQLVPKAAIPLCRGDGYLNLFVLLDALEVGPDVLAGLPRVVIGGIVRLQ
ncbi:MAG TPA: hypothetical protein VKV40_06720 [Ktedonobacteraceae bacterium]|nr:hypothetical protein [Ktedonobacteraceae bacterium]